MTKRSRAESTKKSHKIRVEFIEQKKKRKKKKTKKE